MKLKSNTALPIHQLACAKVTLIRCQVIYNTGIVLASVMKFDSL